MKTNTCLKMDKRSEHTYHQRKYTDGKQAYEMLLKITVDGQDTEQQGLSFIARENAKWYSYFGRLLIILIQQSHS